MLRQWTRLLQCLSRRVGSCGVSPLIESLSGSSSALVRVWRFSAGAYERFTSGEPPRRRSVCGPSVLFALLCVPVARSAPRVVLVSVAELGTDPRSTLVGAWSLHEAPRAEVSIDRGGHPSLVTTWRWWRFAVLSTALQRLSRITVIASGYPRASCLS